jgi:hypothetical protein
VAELLENKKTITNMADNLLIPFYLSGLESNPPPSGACFNPDTNAPIACATCPIDNGIPQAITYNCGFTPGSKMVKIEEATPGAGYTICGDDNCLASGDVVSGKTAMVWKPAAEASRFKFLGVPQPISGTLRSNGQLEVSGSKLYLIQISNQCLEASGPDTTLVLGDCVQATPNDVATYKHLFIVLDASGKIREDLDVTSNPNGNGTSTGNGGGASTGNTGGTSTGNGASTGNDALNDATKLGWSMSVLISLFL